MQNIIETLSKVLEIKEARIKQLEDQIGSLLDNSEFYERLRAVKVDATVEVSTELLEKMMITIDHQNEKLKELKENERNFILIDDIRNELASITWHVRNHWLKKE